MSWWQRQFGDTTRGRIVALLRRSERSVEELAEALALTDNAVRSQLATLERTGVVQVTGIRRNGAVGKPAMLYGILPQAIPLFSSAYAPVLTALLSELMERLPSTQFDAALRAVGRRVAPAMPGSASFTERARAGAALLGQLGADADLVRAGRGFEIRAHGCVLSEAVAACPATCKAVEALLSEVTGGVVREHCDRSGAPNCRFLLEARG